MSCIVCMCVCVCARARARARAQTGCGAGHMKPPLPASPVTPPRSRRPAHAGARARARTAGLVKSARCPPDARARDREETHGKRTRSAHADPRRARARRACTRPPLDTPHPPPCARAHTHTHTAGRTRTPTWSTRSAPAAHRTPATHRRCLRRCPCGSARRAAATAGMYWPPPACTACPTIPPAAAPAAAAVSEPRRAGRWPDVPLTGSKGRLSGSKGVRQQRRQAAKASLFPCQAAKAVPCLAPPDRLPRRA